MIIVSMCLMDLGVFLASFTIPLYVEEWNSNKSHSAVLALSASAYISCLVGVAGIYANMVQFGLDQLMESSSRYLSLYLHWLNWFVILGRTIGVAIIAITDCDYISNYDHQLQALLQFISLPIFLILVISSIIMIRFRRVFYTERGSITPYKKVIRILGYALKHRHPQGRRSAFYFHSGLYPGRLDLAKMPYGGPYEVEDVENVKTFLQLLRFLLSIGPISILSMASSYFMYQRYVYHLVDKTLIEEHCPAFWSTLGSGNISNMVSVMFYPLYIFVIFKVYKQIPKMFTRIFWGLVASTLCFVSLLMTEVVSRHQFVNDEDNENKTLYCALTSNASVDTSLNAHWSSLLAPTVIRGLAQPIITTTVFEFIAAQSPRAMTGLLIGTLFSIKGIFELFGVVISVPFTMKSLWDHKETPNLTDSNFAQSEPHSFATSCELWYFVVTIVVGILGIVAFSIVALKYKYRKRDESPFPQAGIEEIVARNIVQEPRSLSQVASPVEVNNDEWKPLCSNQARYN